MIMARATSQGRPEIIENGVNSRVSARMPSSVAIIYHKFGHYSKNRVAWARDQKALCISATPFIWPPLFCGARSIEKHRINIWSYRLSGEALARPSPTVPRK